MIEITQEAFTNMAIIRVRDALTHQVLVLTPDELELLKIELFDRDTEGLENLPGRFEAKQLKALTLYNGHALPTIDRAEFEKRYQVVGPRFYFLVIQNFKNDETHEPLFGRVVGQL